MSLKSSKENLSKTEKPTKFEYIFEDDESKSYFQIDFDSSSSNTYLKMMSQNQSGSMI